MTKEETIFQKHLLDLSEQSWNKDIPVFSDFLDLNEQNIYHSLKSRLSHIHCRLFGGYEFAERQMLGFLPDAFCFDETSEIQLFPLTALHVTFQDPRFAESLSHRDYLGSLMNLGIERRLVGDILVEDTGAYVFCTREMAGYLSENLLKVKHTLVHCEEAEVTNISYHPNIETLHASVSSLRLDSLLGAALTGSRSSLSGLITAGQVYVNGRQVVKASYEPPSGAIISVRGQGRFRYVDTVHQTKKGRLMVHLEKYV